MLGNYEMTLDVRNHIAILIILTGIIFNCDGNELDIGRVGTFLHKV